MRDRWRREGERRVACVVILPDLLDAFDLVDALYLFSAFVLMAEIPDGSSAGLGADSRSLFSGAGR